MYVPNFCSVNTAYRTDASDSFAFKFLDGICTTVIEVDNLCLCVQPSNILQRPRYQDLLQVDGSLPGDLCCGLLWGLGDRKVVLRSKNRGRVGILFKPKTPRLTNSKQDHLVCVPQVSDPAQRRRSPGSGPRGLPRHLRFAVSTTSLATHPLVS